MLSASLGEGQIVRARLVPRIAAALMRGRAPVLLSGPGMGKTRMAETALEQLHLPKGRVPLIEIPDHTRIDAQALDAAAEATGSSGAALWTGGLELHRWLEQQGPDFRLGSRKVQRFPLVPWVRHDVLAWTRGTVPALTSAEFARLFRSTGGHPALLGAWLEAYRRGVPHDAIESELITSLRRLLSRIDQELAHPELQPLYAWLVSHGTSSVAAFQHATQATKARIDRLVLVGVVARTLGQVAEIALSSELYCRYRTH